ncbi:MAG TPA: SPASM domain-containing protein, partial [Patescibacteria group bacterium]
LKDEFVIDGLGDVYYCLSVKPIGNLIKEKKTVSQIYFDPKNISFRKSLIKTSCKKCNSGCNAVGSLTYDFKKLLWFKVTGKIWPWGM